MYNLSSYLVTSGLQKRIQTQQKRVKESFQQKISFQDITYDEKNRPKQEYLWLPNKLEGFTFSKFSFRKNINVPVLPSEQLYPLWKLTFNVNVI